MAAKTGVRVDFRTYRSSGTAGLFVAIKTG